MKLSLGFSCSIIVFFSFRITVLFFFPIYGVCLLVELLIYYVIYTEALLVRAIPQSPSLEILGWLSEQSMGGFAAGVLGQVGLIPELAHGQVQHQGSQDTS